MLYSVTAAFFGYAICLVLYTCCKFIFLLNLPTYRCFIGALILQINNRINRYKLCFNANLQCQKGLAMLERVGT